MTNVLVTGGAGFLGSRLARDLLAAGTIGAAGGGPAALGRLTLVDQAPVPADIAADPRVTPICGDLGDLLAAASPAAASPADTSPADTSPADTSPAGTSPADTNLADTSLADALAAADVIFHLAAAVSAECEADFDLGMRANLHGTQSLLASCRALGTSPVLVFASSVAVFGASAEHPLPAVVDDHTAPNPQSSYGTQKLIGERLVADYTRKGFVRGRTVRLMTVVVRPGRPNAAASGFLSSIIREPLAGQRATCPVDPGTEVALASPARAIEGLFRAASAAEETWGGRSAVNLPSVTVTIADMVAALGRAAGPAARDLIDWVPDPAVARIVTGWPARFRTDRAAGLGLAPDPDFDSVIALHVAEHPSRT